MPLLKGTAGKAMPDMAIGYVTRKDKARYIDVQNLFIDEDYSEQFKETAARFGEYTDLQTLSRPQGQSRSAHGASVCKGLRGKDVRRLRVRHSHAHGYADRSQPYRGQCRPPCYGKETAF